MTVQEYIENDHPFYHITRMNYLCSILEEGLLRNKTKRGICVVRSDEEDVLYEIIDRQLHTLDVNDLTTFALIRLTPQRHGILASEVIEHPNDEVAAPLYNFIDKKVIKITEDDIVRRDMQIGKWRETKTDVVGLTDYCI